MKVFTSACLDNKHRLKCVLSECSFNMACDYVNRHIESVKQVKSNNINEYTIITDNFRFLYDEETGFLLELYNWVRKELEKI